MKKIRLLIVDDHPLMRRALQAAIETEPDMEVIGIAVNGVQAQAIISELQPDVVLMDLLMPGGNGLDAIASIHAEHPMVNILVVTSLEEQDKIVQAIRAGAQGYLTKAADTEELLDAIRSVDIGQSYLPPHIAAKLMNSVRAQPVEAAQGKKPIEELTRRELEVFGFLGQGLSNAKIGNALHISPSTVNVHIHNIMNKLGFDKRRELVVYAAQKQKL